MLRNKLLTTTTLIIAGSVCFSPAQSAGFLGNPEKDRNGEFLCTYGYSVYDSYIYSSSYRARGWQRYAVPIKGKGQTVSEIVVTDSPSSGSDSSRFSVGIYRNSKGGKPGKLIARGTGRAKGGCSETTVTIPQTFLTFGQTYWIEERVGVNRYSGVNYHAVKWGYNSNAKHNAYYRKHLVVSSSSSSTTDWLPVSGPAPFVKVK